MTTKVVSRSIVLFIILSSLLVLAGDVTKAQPPTSSETSPAPTPSASGIIDRETFLFSIPSKMIVGHVYKAVVIITNTGNETTNFLVQLVYPSEYALRYFYSQQVWKTNTVPLDPGASQKIEFDIIPLIEHAGALEIEARVYQVWPISKQADSVSAKVYEIKNVIPTSLVLGLIALLLIVLLLIVAIKLLKNKSGRLDFLIALVLFFLAVLPRAYLATRAAVHLDEYFFWFRAYNLLADNWAYTVQTMVVGYPPLFFYLSAAMISIFGNSLMTIRTISIISGSLSVVVTYFLGKSLFNRKVGLVSALLLCFASYNILYNAQATTDSIVILLILSTAYFFWIGLKRNALKYFVLSGVLLGLAFDVKYVVIIVIPAVILFSLWIEKSLRALLRRNFLVLGASFLIMIFPVQFTLLTHNINPVVTYLRVSFGSAVLPTQSSTPIIELIPRGFRMFVYSMARAASPWLPWLTLFEIAICISLFVTIAIYAIAALKGRPSESFALIFMAAMLFLLIDPVKHSKWLVYSFPFFFIMLSDMILRYIGDIRSKISRSAKFHGIDLFKIFALLFALIFASSSMMVGLAAPFIDQGEFAGLPSSMLFIKNRATPNDTLAGFHIEATSYYLNVYDIQVTCVSLAVRPAPEELLSPEAGILREFKVNGQLLMALKPKFIIEDRMDYDYYYNITIKQWLLENYDLVFFSRPQLGYRWIGTEYQEWLIFERKA